MIDWTRNARRTLIAVLALTLALPGAVVADTPASWTQWGGPGQDFRAPAAEIADSWGEYGPKQLWSRELGDGYELVIGERRWRAAQHAGLTEVPCVIIDATDRGVLEMALVENVQRADLNPIELAEAFRTLIQDEGMTQDDVSRRVGLDRSSISNHLRILELPGVIQQDLVHVREGSLAPVVVAWRREVQHRRSIQDSPRM